MFSSWHFAMVIGYNLESKHMILRSGWKFHTIMSFKTFNQVWKPGGNWAIVTLIPGEFQILMKNTNIKKQCLD